MSDILIYTSCGFLVLILFRLLKYISTPFLKRIRIYRYYSPMFLTAYYGPRLRDIHLGTSLDYLKLSKKSPKLILFYIAEGLLNLCREIESGKIDGNMNFKGNVYYLKESTIRKFGFNTRKMNPLEFVLFVLNTIELSLFYSISHKKITGVPVNNVMEICITASELLKNKHKYEMVYERLKRSVK